MFHFLRSRVRGCPFTDLSPPAQQQAVATVAAQLPTTWDSHHSHQLAVTAAHLLAGTFGNPTGDLGDHIHIDVWDTERGRHLSISGQLDRATAPALPWPDHIDAITLTAGGPPRIQLAGVVDRPAVQAICHAVQAAIDGCWKTARDQTTTRAARQHALEWIAVNQPRFGPDGTLHTPSHQPAPQRKPPAPRR